MGSISRCPPTRLSSAGGSPNCGRKTPMERTTERHSFYDCVCYQVGFDRLYETLTEVAEAIVREGPEDPAIRAYCLGYHTGNYSPRADHSLQGIMAGRTFSHDRFDQSVKFRATLQELSYRGRKLVERIRATHQEVKFVNACVVFFKSRPLPTELIDCISVLIALSSGMQNVSLRGATLHCQRI